MHREKRNSVERQRPVNSPGHEMIMASAGSGKTYALTNRYVRLLALGASPERIVALTFTRKAAGEFFDEILKKLATAAADAARAAQLARELELTAFSADDFRSLLRHVVDLMPRLALGTFDAFFARIVRTFPLELGLGGDFTLLEDYAAQFERRRVLRELFASSGREPDAAQREFIEAFKRATFGREEKRLARLLDGFIDAHQQDFFAAPAAEAWGDPALIWPEGCSWLEAAQLEPAASVLRTWVEQAPLSDRHRARWLAFSTALETWSPGVNPSHELIYVIKKALESWDDLGRGQLELSFDRKKVSLPPEPGAALRTIIQAIYFGEYTRRLAATRGIHGVLARYDAGYELLVRRAGRLTFSDVERLLRGVEVTSTPASRPTARAAGHETAQLEFALDQTALALPADTASPRESAAERRLLLDWRLDAQFDHWLLDEFQDTSRGHWDVLRNLIDEVVQDASHSRTFFCVGDVKQAIYGWRGGDSRLFREILEYYNAGTEPAIILKPMDESWRSGPPLLEMVNRIFGDTAALAELSPEAAERWARDWRAHTSAVPARTGQAAWLHAETEEERFERTCELLVQIDPVARGLSVAVLTQKNDIATRLADYLRRVGRMPAVAEADTHVCTDNPATAAVLALFKAAAHPGDTLAWQHVAMTPLQAALLAENCATPDALTAHVLSQVHRGGFEATVEWWWRRLEPQLDPGDIFTHGRGRQLVEAARRFDDTGSRDVAEFLQFAERHVVRDTESAGVVRVMTIHKAKGLGFDVVILPDLEGKRLATRREGLAVHRGEDHDVEWVLDLPTKFFRERDDILAAHVRDEEAEACYERIALLYVGLTRAKRGLYVITSSGADTASLNFPRLLATTLGSDARDIRVGGWHGPGAFTAGDDQWFTAVQATPPPPPSPLPATLDHQATPPLVRYAARTPSDHWTGTVSGAALFAATQSTAADFGTAVHAAFAAVEWWEPAKADVWAKHMRAAGLPEDAIAAARACLEAPDLADVFRSHASGATEVWRERSFELVHENSWITGRFDRVLLERGTDGAVVRIRVIDFKTDRVGEARAAAAERYRSQVAWYRRAAAVLAGVAEARVSCEIVFTAARDASGLVPAAVVLA